MSNSHLASTERFSNRVENYINFRPGYPKEIVDVLVEECGLSADSVIADIGSGTGIFSELFLKQGYFVFGIEPNKEMREAAEKLLSRYDKFTSIKSTAEATSLNSQSIDIITGAQAFHWFNLDKARQEFLRILKSDGWLVIVWNDRKTDSTPFLIAYEQLLRNHSIDYEKVDHKNISENDLQKFLDPNSFEIKIFENKQIFDFQGLQGRLLSSSYAPFQDHPKYANMINDLELIFEKYCVDNKVEMEYETKMYYGQLLGIDVIV